MQIIKPKFFLQSQFRFKLKKFNCSYKNKSSKTKKKYRVNRKCKTMEFKILSYKTNS